MGMLPQEIKKKYSEIEAILTGICKCELTAMQLNEHTRKNKITKYV